jgi:hypothetical protein
MPVAKEKAHEETSTGSTAGRQRAIRSFYKEG